MHVDQQKEQISNAYVRAIAATAGFSVSEPNVDDDSVDLTIGQTGGAGTVRSPKLDLQLKCVSRNARGLTIREEDMSYRLKLKNYDDLRHDDFAYPRILVLVIVPQAVDQWLNETEDALAMNSCGYWVSLRGAPGVDIQGDKTTVRLPRTQMFNVEQVTQLLINIGNGVRP